MARFILGRLVQGLFVFLGIITIVFLLVRVIGDPAALMLPQDASREAVEQLTERLGLARPIHVQYAEYMSGLVRGDLGQSLWTRAPVTGMLRQYFPATLMLASVTLVVALALGVTLGLLAAGNQGSLLDRFVTWISYVCVSFPEFWLGLLLISLVAVQLGWLPTSGFGGWRYFVLPVLTLMIRPVGRLAQTTRAALREQLAQPYAFTGLAKGLRRRAVVLRHALRNSMLSVITLAGDSAADLVAGAVAVEVVFGWPGVGYLTIQAIERRDPQLLVGIVIVVAAFVLVLNFVIDLLYKVLDPRIETR